MMYGLVDRIKSHLPSQGLRAKMIKKLCRASIWFVVLILLLIIWGVKKGDIMVFISSFITIIGIAFVAQWSFLSNITATIIIFINHPIKIGDHVTIMDKDNEVTGVIKDFGIFFVTLKTKDKSLVSVPSSLLLQKMVCRHFDKDGQE
jgi:small-conductance mechanosensitive channel